MLPRVLNNDVPPLEKLHSYKELTPSRSFWFYAHGSLYWFDGMFIIVSTWQRTENIHTGNVAAPIPAAMSLSNEANREGDGILCTFSGNHATCIRISKAHIVFTWSTSGWFILCILCVEMRQGHNFSYFRRTPVNHVSLCEGKKSARVCANLVYDRPGWPSNFEVEQSYQPARILAVDDGATSPARNISLRFEWVLASPCL